MKKCSRDSLCFNTAGQGVSLYDDEFDKNKNWCKHCVSEYNKKYRKNNFLKIKEYNNKYRFVLINVLEQRVNSSNLVEKNRCKKKKSTPNGKGKWKKLWAVLGKRINKANTTSSKRDKNMIEINQVASLLITQNYVCPITGFDISKNYSQLSLEHIVPNEQGGLNVIENVLLVCDMFNYAKNGYDMQYALDTMLKIAYPDDFDKRKNRIDEIMNKIWDIQQIYPKVYEKISKMNKDEIQLTLDNKVKVIDLLNT